MKLILSICEEGEILKLTTSQLLALRRKRGELNYSISDLANELNISRRTLAEIINSNHSNVNLDTFTKINNWIIDKYTKIGAE